MIAIEDTDVVTPKRLLSRQPKFQSNGFSFPIYKGVKKDIEVKKQIEDQEEFPIEKWIMPPQPDSYLKYSDYDLL